VILKVVDKELAALQKQLDEKSVVLEVTKAARSWLAENGYDPALGARPMARLVEKQIKRKLADAVLFGALADGGKAKFDVSKDGKDLVLAPVAETVA
jgi:ATP-dependent Clp protease ATP-binding subunit ClpA